MAEPVSIKRRKASDSELSFESLRSEAIELIQRVSGQVWTDYNVHDPGVTVLEQLVYALTDLSYRCEFALEDYLADEDGRVNLEAQALHAPADIFPCRPTTPDDYRKLLLNALPEIDNVRLSEMTGPAGLRGIYRLSVKLAHGLEPDRRDTIINDIHRIYRVARNLCEDLGEVRVIENIEYELCANIEVSSARYPADILADIYFACARRIARSAAITNYDQIDTETETLAHLFEGPFTDRGFFQDDDSRRPQSEFPVSALFSIVNAVDGVDQIQRLYLSRDGENIYDRIDVTNADHAFDLAVPTSAAGVKVELTTNGRVLPISIADMSARYDEIRFKYYASRSTEQKLSLLYQPIEGTVRPLNRYFSIQNQFPVNYGINRFGVPASASAEVKARVRQLKAYLVIFEQYLLNFLANLDSVDVLFSPQTEPRISYASQTLDPRQVEDLDAVYPPAAEQVFRRITAGFDNYDERKSRLLDYLLALYGERFSQNSLRHFNYYYGKDEIDAVIVANKVAFLNAIIELGRDRAAAPDYHAKSIYQTSGLALRAAMLLGFERTQAGALTAMFKQQALELCPHPEFQRRKADSDALRLVDSGDIGSGQYSQPALIPIGSDFSLQRIRDELATIVPLENGVLSETLLREGIDITGYRVGRRDSYEDYRLCFRLGDNEYWHLGSFRYRSVAERAANYLREYLLRLNRHSEGIHIVEHILLRPRQATAKADDNDFYSFRISALLPGWSKRCSDRDFRNLVRETVRLNAPAHVFVEFYWLDFEQMREFEQCYESWPDLKRDPAADVVELDRRARAVIEFLAAARQTQPDEVWLSA
jgi:hypothetical protein